MNGWKLEIYIYIYTHTHTYVYNITCNCNCNLFTVHKSSIGYNQMDIDIVTVYNINNVILSTHMMGLITINIGI